MKIIVMILYLSINSISKYITNSLIKFSRYILMRSNFK